MRDRESGAPYARTPWLDLSNQGVAAEAGLLAASDSGEPHLEVVRGEVAPQVSRGRCSFMHVELINCCEALSPSVAKG